jgi:hypothetical protein
MPQTHTPQTASRGSEQSPQYYEQFDGGAAEQALDLFKQFARERPEVVAMWAFGVGFVLGWKLRIW